ncbi:MAG: 16S rRNA (uracil(1498)-N(3))-methyltransferase [Planctomycetes bacterium]|nr:16S rRNA (uracil(1498)-N(3))-methyltransferase [Planctomycetota bacterium]
MMHMHRFFLEQTPSQGLAFLSGDEFHHLRHVLRAEIGSEVVLFDAAGHEFTGRVETLSKRGAVVRIVRENTPDPPCPLRITLAWGLCKGKAADWMLQKGTELGVARFQPFVSARSNVRVPAKPEEQRLKWRRTTIEAAKQCGRSRLPEVEDAVPFPIMLERAQDSMTRLMPHPGSPARLKDVLRKDRLDSVWVAVGPEGGWDPEEVVEARTAGFILVSLGPWTLRSETAALAVLSVVASEKAC